MDLFPGNEVVALRCTTCGKTLPVAEFPPKTFDASSHRCIECLRQGRLVHYRKTAGTSRLRYKTNLQVNMRQRLRSGGFRGEDCETTMKLLIEKLRASPLCPHCGVNLTVTNYAIDHIIPVAKGGPETDPLNLRIICVVCNRAKGTMSEPDFKTYLRMVAKFQSEGSR